MPITLAHEAVPALNALQKLTRKQALMTIGAYAQGTQNPHFIEAIIIQPEAMHDGEHPDFISRTP